MNLRPINELIDDFNNHPFKVVEDESLKELADSINENGLLEPLVVRRKENGRYEMLSGHRRKKALELIGATEAICNIKDLSDEEKASLKGDNGDKGEQGDKGVKGDTGIAIYNTDVNDLIYNSLEAGELSSDELSQLILSAAQGVILGNKLEELEEVYVHRSVYNTHKIRGYHT